MNRKKVLFIFIVLIPMAISLFMNSEDCKENEENLDCKPSIASAMYIEHSTVECLSDIRSGYAPEFSEEDINLIRRTVYCESGNQDYETQVMVAKTIINRVRSELFPETVTEVVYQPNQYEVTEWENFEEYYWTKQVEDAVNEAIITTGYPEDMFYFRNDYYHNFGYPYASSGILYFSTQEEN